MTTKVRMKNNVSKKKLIITFVLLIPNLTILLLQTLDRVNMLNESIMSIMLLFVFIGGIYYLPAQFLFGSVRNPLFTSEDGFIMPATLSVNLLFTVAYGLIFYFIVSHFYPNAEEKK